MKVTHIEHVEDLILNGRMGLYVAIRHILSVKDWIYYDGRSPISISIKMDGSPTVVFGWHDNRFFVGTKRVFNKTPVRFFTFDDIQKSYPNHPELVSKLDNAHTNLRNVVPPGEVYQGDYLFDPKSWSHDGLGFKSCQPNLIKYRTNYEHLTNCRLGIAIHNKYKWTGDTYRIIEDWDWEFEHANLFLFNPKLKRYEYSSSHLLDCLNSFIKEATIEFHQIDYAWLTKRARTLRSFIHWAYRESKPISVESLIDYNPSLSNEDLSVYEHFFNAHKSLTQAKLLLIPILDQFAFRSGYVTCLLNNEPTGHEGYVCKDRLPGSDILILTKFVNRSVMSHGLQNLVASKKAAAICEKV